MKRLFLIGLLGCLVIGLLGVAAYAQFSFYLIDNFESGEFAEGSKWWKFGEIKVKVISNPTLEGKDLIAESCGEYALNISGAAKDWYIGGMGTDLGIDASTYSRFQVDVSGGPNAKGKLVIEFFDDDNQNHVVEQDPTKNYEPVKDDKWVAEINILGEGFTRTSIPFTAFKDVNPGVGDDIWNPNQANGSGGLLKFQLVLISTEKQAELDFDIDNILLTY